MNYRKFYLILFAAISVLLFISGTIVLSYINIGNSSGTGSKSVFNDILDPYKIPKDPFNILVLGGDKVNKNSDTIMLVNYNPATAKINLLSIPRDTKVNIEGHTRKINYAYPHAGKELALSTVSELLKVNIKYFMYIDTSIFVKIIDVLGGVDIDIPVKMDYDDPFQNLHIHFEKGFQHLTGKQAEEYVRFREPNTFKNNKELKEYYDGSDLDRIDAQQNFIKEVIRQKASISNITRLKDIINIIFANIDTNMEMNEILKLSGSINKLSIDNVNMLKLPGAPIDRSPWYYVCDAAKTEQIIAESFSGTGEYVGNSGNIADNTGSSSGKNGSKSSASGSANKSSSKPAISGTAGKSSVKPSEKPVKQTNPVKTDVTKNNPSNSESSNEPISKNEP